MSQSLGWYSPVLQELHFFKILQKISKFRNSTLIYGAKSSYLKSVTFVPDFQNRHHAKLLRSQNKDCKLEFSVPCLLRRGRHGCRAHVAMSSSSVGQQLDDTKNGKLLLLHQLPFAISVSSSGTGARLPKCQHQDLVQSKHRRCVANAPSWSSAATRHSLLKDDFPAPRKTDLSAWKLV